MNTLIAIAVVGLLACPGLSMAGGDKPTAHIANLNLAKSNINRKLDPPTDPASDTTTATGSKSNSDNPTSGQSGQSGIAVSDPGVPSYDAEPVKTK